MRNEQWDETDCGPNDRKTLKEAKLYKEIQQNLQNLTINQLESLKILRRL